MSSGLQGSLNQLVAEVPIELWVEVCELGPLDPVDVLSLSQTCHALRGSIMQKEVWIPVLRAMCKKHSLFMHSFPVDEMSVDQLQRATLGPYRWGRMISKTPDGSELQPVSLSRLPFFDSVKDIPYLVPGGRYLVLLTSKSLALWDLGPPGSRPLETAKCRAQVQVRWPYRPDKMHIVGGIFSDNKLRIVVAAHKINSGVDRPTSRIIIYDICPDDSPYSIKPISHLVVIMGRTFRGNGNGHTQDWFFRFHLHYDRLLIRMFDTMLVWDFISGKYAKWSTDISDNSLRIEPARSSLFIGNRVIEFNAEELLVWVVPPLESDLEPEDPTIDFPLMVSTIIPLEIPMGESLMRGSAPLKFAISGTQVVPSLSIPFHYTVPFPFRVKSELGSLDTFTVSRPSWFAAMPECPIPFDTFLVTPDSHPWHPYTSLIKWQLHIDRSTISELEHSQLRAEVLDSFKFQHPDVCHPFCFPSETDGSPVYLVGAGLYTQDDNLKLSLCHPIEDDSKASSASTFTLEDPGVMKRVALYDGLHPCHLYALCPFSGRLVIAYWARSTNNTEIDTSGEAQWVLRSDLIDYFS